MVLAIPTPQGRAFGLLCVRICNPLLGETEHIAAPMVVSTGDQFVDQGLAPPTGPQEVAGSDWDFPVH